MFGVWPSICGMVELRGDAGGRIQMSHAELCPICKGKGLVKGDLKDSTASYDKICHGCGGLGWVTIRDWERQGVKGLACRGVGADGD